MTQGEYEMRVRRQDSFLLAQDGQFLGMLSANKYQSDSVMNEYESYGSKYSSTSIFNQYGQSKVMLIKIQYLSARIYVESFNNKE